MPEDLFLEENSPIQDVNLTPRDVLNPKSASLGLEEDVLLEEIGEQEIVMLNEEPLLREENVKHFRMSDGSYIAAQYNMPVHFKESEEDEWQDIDSTLLETEDGYKEEIIARI